MRFLLPIKNLTVRYWLIAMAPMLISAIACLIIWYWPEKVGMLPGSLKHSRWITGLGATTAVTGVYAVLTWFSARSSGRQSFDLTRAHIQGDDQPRISESYQHHQQSTPFADMYAYLHRQYGLFWRQRVRVILVIGEETEVASIAPTLAEKQWLEGEGTVLIYGGSPQESVALGPLSTLRKLRSARPVDGIILSLSYEQASSAQWMSDSRRSLEQTGNAYHWLPPIWLWQTDPSMQGTRITQAVGVFFHEKTCPESVGRELTRLLPQLCEQGMRQIFTDNRHDYLLRLGQWLKLGGIESWQRILTPWLSGKQWRMPICGLMFSPSVTVAAASVIHAHYWSPPAAFHGVLKRGTQATGRHMGLSQGRIMCYVVAVVIGLWGVGSLLSFAANYYQMTSLTNKAQQLAIGEQVSDAELIQLNELRNDIERIQTQKNTIGWRHFGLNHDTELLAVLLPIYGVANNRLMRDEAARVLSEKLDALTHLPPGSQQRADLAKSAYDQLKAWLMMGRPEKADPAFFSQVMTQTQPTRKGISTGIWQSLSPDLWGFYMQTLPGQPDWKIIPDAQVMMATRQILLAQIEQRNGDNAIYLKMLGSVSRNFPDMPLAQMTNDTDAAQLFTTSETVPGVFTRQAWEGQVQQAIADAVASRREEIDWVLSDNQKNSRAEVSPEALKQRLTDRYFSEYSGSWLKFLNSLRWKPARNLSDVVDQLTLMSDVRQSPVVALMNTVAWQGQAGKKREALSDSLMKSAEKILQKEEEAPVIDQHTNDMTGPLDETFGPLLAIAGKGDTPNNLTTETSLSFQTFLTRVTRVRLKLLQVTHSADPQVMMQQLAQTVFQGKNIDLTDTREYGSLLAAGLGEEWSGFGDALFVQPLTQAWEQVLQPSAAGINESWQRTVVSDWQEATDGRYPVSEGRSDIPLPVLAEFIRRDSGKIDQFLHENLAGLMHREGRRWEVDEMNTQGLIINPEFIQAVNRLGEVRDALFADGSQGMRFELRARPVPDVVETILSIDGQRLHYFNQMESWQSFRWPGESQRPGAMLTWTTTQGGANLYGDYPGELGLIRWLEQGRAEKRDDGMWQLTLSAPDGKKLCWLMRTGPGGGPLALLKLRGFVLPKDIFLVSRQRNSDAGIN